MSWTITPQTKVPVDPQYGSVSLLLHGNGTNGSTTITDNSPSPKTVTAVGNAQISTAQSKFGGSSMLFDGSTSYLTTPANPSFAYNADFTVECWFYLIGSAFAAILDINSPGNFGFGVSSTQVLGYETQLTAYTANQAISLNTWHHVALSRSGTTLKTFFNGSTIGTFTGVATSYLSSGILNIGRNPGANNSYFNGYIDDLRITKGVARYTANFTPPAAPFPDI